MTAVPGWRGPALHCPACTLPLSREEEQLSCGGCGRRYPVLFDIPDLRLKPDRYLSLADERAKAARLHEFGREATFDELLAYYYRITDDVSPELARRFAAYVRNGPARAADLLDRLGPGGTGATLLDLGCGAGGALIAGAPRYDLCVGVDIGLRWLVIAQKRLEEAGLEAQLVCADAEALPFAGAAFTHVVADDLLDHVRHPLAAVANAVRLVRPGGKLWISAINRWWIGPHPAVGLIAAGMWPAAARRAYARLRGGIDTLRHASFVSAGQVSRAVAGELVIDRVGPRTIAAPLAGHRSPAARLALRIYRALSSAPLLTAAMAAAGPAFELVAHRPVDGTKG